MTHEEYLKKLYFGSMDRKFTVRGLLHSAERMLAHAPAHDQWNEMAVMAAHVKTLVKTEEGRSVIGAAFRFFSKGYRYILDDVIFISAFEMYGKAVLLSAGYAVHSINGPAELKKLQKSTPVSLRRIAKEKATGNNLNINFYHTISASQLLTPSYAKKLSIGAPQLKALEEMNSRRNALHFHTYGAYGFEQEYFETVGWLVQAIRQKLKRLGKG